MIFKMNEKTIQLKKIKEEDLETIVKWRNDKNIMKYNTQFILLNMEHQKKWYNSISKKDSDRIMFLFKYGKDIVGIGGLIHLDKENKNADIAIIIGKTEMHRKGLGTKALQLLVDYGFHKMKLHRIGAEIFEYNTISLNLFEKLNFKEEGILTDALWRFGRWWNIYKYSIIN